MSVSDSISTLTVMAAQNLSRSVGKLEFAEPITHIYNPLEYAWNAHERYLRKHANSIKQVIFLGMNPGPFGMAQTGVPFGEVEMVRDWVGINIPVEKPALEHPKRPVDGFDCLRSEVSGRRLWGLFRERFSSAEAFFTHHFVANYCPLVFMEDSGRNRTPDKLPVGESTSLYKVCDRHLCELVAALKPDWVIGIGAFAENRVKIALKDSEIKVGRILHPSPASPAANRGWGEQATRQLEALSIW